MAQTDEEYLPLLASEKVLLLAQQYLFAADPFVGIIDVRLNTAPDISKLTEAYRYLIAKRISFNIIFTRKGNKFYKQRTPIPFLAPKLLKNKTEFELWKKRPLDLNIGPLHEMSLWKRWGGGYFLYFKFHHLIMDGFGLFYFFRDLFEIYEKLIAGESPNIQSDSLAYSALMSQYLALEKKDSLVKQNFWKDYLEKESKPSPPMVQCSSENVTEYFCLSRRHVFRLYRIKTEYNLSFFSIFVAAYAMALQEVFDISSLPLRVATSLRQGIEDPQQQSLIASLSRGFPLILDRTSSSIRELAHESRAQVKKLCEYLPVDSDPWSQKHFRAFSKKKKCSLSFLMSNLYYQEKTAAGVATGISWQAAAQDLFLFIVLSERRVLFSLSYKKVLFSDAEIKEFKKIFKKKILSF